MAFSILGGLAQAGIGIFASMGTPDYPDFGRTGKEMSKINKKNYDTAMGISGEMLNASKWDIAQSAAPATMDWQKVDIAKEADQAMAYNLANLDKYKQVASTINAAAVAERLKTIDTMAPEWRDLRASQADVTQAWLRGEVGAGARETLARSSAYNAIQGGFGAGSAQGRSVAARDLGIASAGLQAAGQVAANQWSETLKGLLPTEITANDIMKQQGISSNLAATSAFQNEANRQQVGEFNIATLQNNQQFNAQQTNQSKAQQAQLMMQAYGAKMNAANVFANNQMGVSEGQWNADIGQMNQESKKNSTLWSGIAGGVGSIFGAL